MEKNRLNDANPFLKWVITTFLMLATIGFGVAALMSYQHYDLSREQTIVAFLGDEAQGGMVLPKLYSEVLQTAHVHSFTLPLVFLPLWLGLNWVPLRSFLRKLLVLGGGLSILTYNAAPFLLRYVTPKAVHFFMMGGAGLFAFFFLPAVLVLYETWWGFSGYAKD